MGIFKAYDIRGTVPDQFNPEVARQIGVAFANFITEERSGELPTVGVGRDARPNGDEIAPAFVDGILATGASVVDFGQVTTPQLYYAIGSQGLDAGAIVTASHNPPQYNGIKFTRQEARPISADDGILEFKRRVNEGDLRESAQKGSLTQKDILAAYHDFVVGFAKEPEKQRLKVAVDCGNGMPGLYRPVFERLNVDLVPLFFEVDCTFPNHEANPLKESTLMCLKEVTRSLGCHFGIGFDGDGDRCILVDETGTVVRSDILTTLLASVMLRRDPGRPIVYDLRSSKILPETVETLGGTPLRERVGHSFAKARMRREGAIYGGELSGHHYYEAAYTADSGIITAIEVMNEIRRTGKPLGELANPYYVYHSTGEVNFEVEDKLGKMKELEATYAPSAKLSDWLDGITCAFETWWFNVRPSNTEPLLRLTLEADTAEEMQARYQELEGKLGTPV